MADEKNPSGDIRIQPIDLGAVIVALSPIVLQVLTKADPYVTGGFTLIGALMLGIYLAWRRAGIVNQRLIDKLEHTEALAYYFYDLIHESGITGRRVPQLPPFNEYRLGHVELTPLEKVAGERNSDMRKKGKEGRQERPHRNGDAPKTGAPDKEDKP